MSKILLIAVALVLIVGGGWYITSYRTSPVPQEVEQSTEKETYSGTLETLINSGKSLKCTWSSEDTGGISWIEGEKIYAEVEAQGQTAKTIMKDNCIWSWAEGQETGVKNCYSSFEEMQQDMEGTQQTDTEEDQTADVTNLTDIEYSCEATEIPTSKFAVPSNVSFIEVDETVPQNGEDVQEITEEDMGEIEDKVQEMLPQ
ncbi:MAG: hypothetical protein ACOC4Z_01305 [Patescibacteria group bacterium]